MKKFGLFILAISLLFSTAGLAQNSGMTDAQLDQKITKSIGDMDNAVKLEESQKDQLTVLYKNMFIEMADIKSKYGDDKDKLTESKKKVKEAFKIEMEKILKPDQLEAYTEYMAKQRDVKKAKRGEREKEKQERSK